MKMQISKGLKFSLAVAFFWALSIVTSRFLLKSGEDPLNLTLWINLFTVPFWITLLPKYTKELVELPWLYKGLLLLIGIAGSIGINYLQSLALKSTTAANLAFLYRTIVVFTIVFAYIFFKEKITIKKIIIVSMILTGSYLLTTNGQTLILTKGDIYTLFTAASAAFVANILVKHTISKMHPDASGIATVTVGTISLLVMTLMAGSFKVPQGLLLIALTGLFSFLTVRFRNFAYKHATASFVTMIVSFTPVFVSLLSFPLLGEKLSLLQLGGGMLIVSSGILAEYLKI